VVSRTGLGLTRWESDNEERARAILKSNGLETDPGSAGRLGRILERCETGFKTDLRTPLYSRGADKGLYIPTREEILEILEKRIGFTRFQELTDIDHHEREKVGPFSIMLPYKDRAETVAKYWTQSFYADQAAFELAVERVRSVIPQRSLLPWDFKTTFGLMPKNTSLGGPKFSSDRRFVQSYLERAIQLSSPEEIWPAVLYWRGQAAGLHEPPKQRVVWGFDHAETIYGATVLYPVLEVLKRLPGHAAWLSEEAVDLAITRILRKADGRRIISMDYSGFDSSLSLHLLNAVDDILASWFDEVGANRVKLVGRIGNTVPLLVPWKVLRGRNGGMPSGSVLTNLRDTIANRVAGEYIGIRSGNALVDMEVLGDDSVFLFAGDMDPSTVTKCVAELGLESNVAKQFVSTRSAHYLQRWHSLDYSEGGVHVGVHSPYRTVGPMLGYEHFRNGWSGYMDSARWIMQVENCRHDPRFVSFVEFLKNGDKILRAGMDPAAIFKRAGGAGEVRDVLRISSFPFNSRDPAGLEAFVTTRVLRQLG
jgi:hypothetical protein